MNIHPGNIGSSSLRRSSMFWKVFLTILLIGSLPLLGGLFWIMTKGTKTPLLYADPSILILLFLCVFITASFLSYILVAPLLRLQSRLLSLRSGEELSREARRRDEIGLLARLFQNLLVETRRKAEWFKRLVDEATQVMLVLEEGRIKYANNATIELLGLSPFELEGSEFSEFVEKEVMELFEKRRKDILRGRAPFSMEIQIKRKDGRKRWMEADTVPIILDGWRGELVMLRDIDKKKKLLEELEIQNKNLSLFNRMSRVITEARTVEEGIKSVLSLLIENSEALGGMITFRDKASGKESIELEGVSEDLAKRIVASIPFQEYQGSKSGVIHLKKGQYPLPLPWDEVLITPLSATEETLGFLVLGLAAGSPYPCGRSFALETLGRHVGLVLDHINLMEKISLKAKRLEALYETALELASPLSFTEVLRKGLIRLKSLLDADSIAAYRLEGDSIRLLFQIGMPRDACCEFGYFKLEKPHIFLDNFPSGSIRTWEEGEPDPPEGIKRALDCMGAKTAIVFSTSYKENDLLQIALAFKEKKEFLKRDLDDLKAGALQLSSSLQTANLFEKVREQNRILSTMNDLFLSESRTSSWSEFLKVVYAKIRGLMPLDSFFIALYEPERGVLRSEISMERNIELEPFEQDPLDSNGLTSYVFREKKPLLVKDYIKEKELLPVRSIIIGKTNRSLIFSPILLGKEVIGVISAQSFEPNAYHEGHVHLLSTLGFQMGLILEKAKLNNALKEMLEDLKRTLKERGLLLQMVRRLAGTTDEESLLSNFLDEIEEAIPFDQAALYLYDAPKKRLKIALAKGISPEDIGVREETALLRHPGWVLREGKPLLVKDTTVDRRVKYPGGRKNTPKSLIYVPVISKGEILGLLGVASFEKGAFDERDLELLSSFSHEVGSALEKIRLYRSLKEQAEELKLLYQISSGLLPGRDFKRHMSRALLKIVDVFKLEGAEIRIFNARDRTLRRFIGVGEVKKLPRKLKLGPGWDIGELKRRSIVKVEGHDYSGLPSLFESHTPDSFVLLPIYGEYTKPVGVMVFLGDQERVFSEREIEILESARNLLSRAFQKWKMYKDVENLKHFFESIVKNISDWIFIVDREGRILFSNKEEAKDFFSKGKKITGENLLTMLEEAGLSPKLRGEIWERLWRYGSLESLELGIEGGRKEKALALRGNVMPSRPPQALLVLHDVTLEREIEEEEFSASR